jgi:hypothetical protein
VHPLKQNVHEEDNYSSTRERERPTTTDVCQVIENEAPRTWKRACNCNQNAKATIESSIILHHISIDFSSNYHKILSQIHGTSWSWYSFIPWISSYSPDPCEPWIFQLFSTQFMWTLWTLDFSFLAPDTPHLPYLGYKFHLLNNTIHTPIPHRTMSGQDCELFLNGEDWIHTFFFSSSTLVTPSLSKLHIWPQNPAYDCHIIYFWAVTIACRGCLFDCQWFFT